MQVLRRFLNTNYFYSFDNNFANALKDKALTLDTIFELDAPIISKSDQSEIFRFDVNNHTYFIKRYFKTKGLVSWFGFSRFSTETHNQIWFNQSKLPSAKVIAYGEERFLLKTKRAVLVTEGIKNTQDLAYIAQHSASLFRNRALREQLLNQCASIMRFFHQNRFCHNDLHWRNILVQHIDCESSLQVYLIDCPSGRQLFWPFLNYKKLKDLANIDKFAPQYLSRTQRLRFFMAYRQIDRLTNTDKKMIVEILKHKANRIKRKSKENS